MRVERFGTVDAFCDSCPTRLRDDGQRSQKLLIERLQSTASRLRTEGTFFLTGTSCTRRPRDRSVASADESDRWSSVEHVKKNGGV